MISSVRFRVDCKKPVVTVGTEGAGRTHPRSQNPGSDGAGQTRKTPYYPISRQHKDHHVPSFFRQREIPVQLESVYGNLDLNICFHSPQSDAPNYPLQSCI